MEDLGFRIHFVSKNTLNWLHVPSLRKNKLETPPGYIIQDILPISNKKVLINGAKAVEECYKEHTVFLVKDTECIQINRHDFGITGFKMLFNNKLIYFISEQKCQVYSIPKNTCKYIQEMNTIHINPGCCLFDNNILVIGGINNKTVELYNTRSLNWVEIAKLHINLYNIGCIQITEDEVLIISFKEYYKLNIKLQEITYSGLLPIKPKCHKIGYPIKQNNLVYCIIASRLLCYNILANKWTIVNRRPNCCCEVI
jgi:WD40 repeat protein